MSILTRSLKNSWLIGPLYQFATIGHQQLSNWWQDARMRTALHKTLLPFLWLFGKLAAPLNTLQGAIYPLLILGVAGLLISFTTVGTSTIGAITGILLLFCLLAGFVFHPPVHRHITMVDVLVALFFGSAVLSTAFSSYVATSIIGLAKLLTFFSGYVVFRVVTHFTVQRQGGLYLLLLILVGLGVFQSVVGFDQYFNNVEPLATWVDPETNPELTMTRIWGTIKPYNPNLLAGFLIPCLGAGIGLSLLFLKKKTWPFGLIAIACGGSILAALVLTGSRGGYLAIGAMGIFLFALLGHLVWHHPALNKLRAVKLLWLGILAISVIGISTVVATSPQIQKRITSIFAMRKDSSISYRMNVYNSAFEMFKDNPVVGIGPGNGTFKQVYGLYMVPGYNALGAYSVPLEIAVEQGMIGLFIFLLLFLVILLRTALALDQPDEEEPLHHPILLITAVVAIVGSLMYGTFDTIWYRPAVNLLFWFFVAVFAAQSEQLLNPAKKASGAGPC